MHVALEHTALTHTQASIDNLRGIYIMDGYNYALGAGGTRATALQLPLVYRIRTTKR